MNNDFHLLNAESKKTMTSVKEQTIFHHHLCRIIQSLEGMSDVKSDNSAICCEHKPLQHEVSKRDYRMHSNIPNHTYILNDKNELVVTSRYVKDEIMFKKPMKQFTRTRRKFVELKKIFHYNILLLVY